MDSGDLKKAGRANLAREIATRHTDPKFYSALTVLPNPDTVLRKLGKSDEAFDAIVSDAHVIGELRSVRSALLGYEWQLAAGGEDATDLRALELCEQFMAQRPAPGLRWPDVIWNMAQAVFRGYQVHEVVWKRDGQFLMPVSVLDRPSRRFVWSTDNALRLITRQSMVEGEELGPYKWLVTRHMPSHDNPYGVALFSSCFWPYTFKHSGFRYFVKFCEKYGIPWAVGKYPEGTPKEQQDALADALAQMIEDAVAAIPDAGKVELLTVNSGMAALPQERLLGICNREMSKALTSQTLATEIQGEGSRAASETHRGREQAVNKSDRTIIEDTMNELLGWITELNIPNAKPPRFEFYEEAEARQDWVDVLDKARHYINIPASFAHDRLQIPLPVDDEEVLPAGCGPAIPQFSSRLRGVDFSASEFPDQTALDKALDSLRDDTLQQQAEAILQPLFTMLNKEGPEKMLEQLSELYPTLDFDALQQKLAQVIFIAQVWGRLNADG